MAGGNRKGPDNRGSTSGRGAGYCAGYDRPGYDNLDFHADERPGGGRIFGRGSVRRAGRGRLNRGAGFGFRNRWWSLRNLDASPEGERQRLQTHADELQTELDNINSRNNNLSGTTSEDNTGETE